MRGVRIGGDAFSDYELFGGSRGELERDEWLWESSFVQWYNHLRNDGDNLVQCGDKCSVVVFPQSSTYGDEFILRPLPSGRGLFE